ncbi:hypothetical protein ABLN64_20565 [Mycobacterium tuberculosis]
MYFVRDHLVFNQNDFHTRVSFAFIVKRFRVFRAPASDTVPIGAPIGRAWLRLFGVLPFDYDRLSIAELEPGRRFREDSTMLSMRQWQHERTVTPEGDTKTIVRDRITFQTRAGLRFAAPLIAAGLRALFGHRHRRLQRHFAQG